MQYSIKEIVKKDETVTEISPQFVTPTSDIAIICHLFYPDIWPEIKEYINRIETPFDLFITIPPHIGDDIAAQLLQEYPDMHLYKIQNRGRDVLPFLLVMDHIGPSTYKYICKLHSKKTGASPLGHVWRKLLYFDLIGSNRTVKETVEMFENDPDIGIITGKNCILDSERYDYGNTTKIDKLVEMSGFLFQDEYLFAGGTMFWIRSELLEPVLKLFKEGKLEFEEEKGQKDNTIAHALERFFGIVCHVKNKKILPSPSHYSELDEKTIEETASLVLSQQYHGKDVFAMQKRKIQEQYDRIDALEELAESMRIKSRIKRLFPKKFANLPGKIKTALSLIKNPAVLKKVLFYLKRGEIRYLIQKIKEKSGRNLNKSAKLEKIVPQTIFKRFKKRNFPLEDIRIDIIIPVYNGFEFLKALFDSIETNTTSPYRLIVVNDCSPDERVKPYLLKRLEKHPDAIFIDHKTNLGFVKSVNEAFTHAQNHFLILNTDTEVPPFWLERLMYPIIHMEKVASTTPFTNAGQIASFPKFLEDNEIFDGMDVATLDKAFRDINPEKFYEEIPTGVGFCMGVNFELAKSIGLFDEETFGKGYGEENDWCQRAIANGYRNLLVPNLFVFHKHGGSFSAQQKSMLMAQNGKKLLERYPNYDKEVSEYIQRDPHRTLRNILVMTSSSLHNEGIHLILDHSLGGGANIYANEVKERYVAQNKKVLYVAYDFYSAQFNFHFDYKEYSFAFAVETIENVEKLFDHLVIQEIFVNSLVSYKETDRMIALLKKLQEIHHSELVIPVHDYYPVCPNFTLLDENSTFCNVPSLERCAQCMANNDLEWKTFGNDQSDVGMWRRYWQILLEEATRIICFSNSSKEIMQKAYPDLDETKFSIEPHQVARLPVVHPKKDPQKKGITIGILGAINLAKGAGVVKQLVKTIEERGLDINIVLIGEISEYIKSDHFHVTGRYERENLPSLIEEHGIDIFLIPSICPETFSYTTQEIIMMRLPLMVFDIGAPAERVKEYDKGYIIPEVTPKAILEIIQSAQHDLGKA